MTFVKRLRLLAVLMGTATAAAAITSSASSVWGGGNAPLPAKPLDPVQAATTAARTRFSQQPTVTYRAASGETLFAWQLKPTLDAAPARERDFVVLIDTSASQAGTAMAQARQIAADLAKHARAGDRIDLWTVNINADSATRSLTQGLQPAQGEAVTQALARLANSEYGSGAVDLPAALTKATKSFESRPNRQQVMLFLGDGESAASAKPFGETARVEWGNTLAEKDVAFVAVPLGVKVQAETLHGLASQTGGAVVRLTDTIDQFRAALVAALDAPVLKVTKATFGPQAIELFPGKLPPLRSDRATLVLGAMPLPVRNIEVRLEGTVAGRPVALTLSESLAEPSAENYFLASLVDQWKSAKDVPAMLAADRTLAMASEQYRLFRDEYTVQGSWAISADRLDHAEKLFQAALKIDPQSGEAQGGLRVVEKIRGGVLKADSAKIALAKGTALTSIQQDPPPATPVPPAGTVPPAGSVPPAAPGAVPPAESSLIEQVRNQQAAQEQAFRIAVEETLRRARGLQNTDPDGAYDDLKRQRDIVLNNDQLSEPVRRRLALDLEAAMNDVRLRAGTIKEQQARERERIAQVRQRRTELDLRQSQEEQTRARVDAFRQLMNQARFEYAQQEAQVMTQERIALGQGVPPAVFASYRIGQAATNIREFSELRRLRENNYLLTMMQVEKSFVPYPDEPPVHFPPAAVWRELTANRVQTYSNNELGPDTPPSLRKLRDVIEGRPGAKRVRVDSTEGLTLEAVLGTLEKYYQDEGIKFVPRNDLFGEERPETKKVKTDLSKLNGLPLGAFLDTMLRDLQMSYIVRPEYIEYGPNTNDNSLRYDEKVTRVFDVAELIVGIPNAQSTSALIQNLQFLGQQATIFGAALQPFAGAAVNPFGLGGFGGAGLGGLGGGIGGFGGGIGGGIAGGLGAGGFGGGQAGFGGQGAAGVGGALGGALGGQMGQQGQLGQLGSAFSIRGNDQSQALLQLITQTVAPGEWNLRTITGFTQNQLQQNFSAEDLSANTLDPRKYNSVGFYPPARALIVRGSHRYHASPSFNLKFVGGAGGMMQGPGVPREGQFAADPKANAKAAAVMAINAKDKDPEALWNVAFAGPMRQDTVIDAVDVLSEMKEFGHASAALKAALRQGRANGIWTHEALAITLKQTQAAPGEVERASLSGIDLDPTSVDCYLKAAKAEAELDQPLVALAFCQRAAALAPNRAEAYVDALRYATLSAKSGDVKSDAVEWASTNLLSRDWAEPGTHADARAQAEGFADQLSRSGQVDRANRLKAATKADKTRDLVIQLLYQGRADLDLEVLEPTGSICNSTRPRTTNGGVLVGDQLARSTEDQSETYTAAAAFAGVYKIAVKPVVGTPIGNRARVRVVMHQGTPEETAQVFSVDVSTKAVVSVELKSGRRTELAEVPSEVRESRVAGSQAPAPAPPSGFSGGFEANSPEPSVPLAVAATEAKVSGAASNLPGLRLETKLGADRKSVVMKARPVFSGPAKDIARPRTSILPGYGA